MRECVCPEPPKPTAFDTTFPYSMLRFALSSSPRYWRQRDARLPRAEFICRKHSCTSTSVSSKSTAKKLRYCAKRSLTSIVDDKRKSRIWSSAGGQAPADVRWDHIQRMRLAGSSPAASRASRTLNGIVNISLATSSTRRDFPEPELCMIDV